jgi:hypothetical protein
MIAKALFLAKSFSAMRMRMFRDHEIPAGRYLGGYLPARPQAAGRIPRLNRLNRLGAPRLPMGWA